MIRVILFFLLVTSLSQSLCFAQVSGKKKFRWLDFETQLHHEIDIQTGDMNIEIMPGTFKKGPRLKLLGVDLNLLPDDYSILDNVSGDEVYFNVPGTGLVFYYKKGDSKLKRIDKTFYRGFNFHSYSFMSRDTLFSIGGEGFWSTNSTLIYFDSNHKEWEKIKTINKGPYAIEWDFVGFSRINNAVFALEGKSEFQNNSFKEKSIWKLDLSSRKWYELGRINTSVFPDAYHVSLYKFWIGEYFIYLDGFDPKVFILDPYRNKVFEYKGSKSALRKGASEFVPVGRNLIVFSSDKNGNYKDSINIDEVIKDSIVLGPLYIKSYDLFNYKILFLIVILMTFGCIYLILRLQKIKKRSSYLSSTNDIYNLPLPSLEVLNYFYQNGTETYISTNQMNEILNIKSNSFDTTRQKRSRDLKLINDYFLLNHDIAESIFRINSEKDKRQTFYGLNLKANKILTKLKFDLKKKETE